jgi:N-acetylglucosaminyldiphosphoundecaprenol N-acetyl-beta-D-mannosaminyltransferase
LKSIQVLGVPVACVTYDSALERIKTLAHEPRPTAVCPSNTHILGEARHDAGFADVVSRFDLVLPDGMPVVWALNLRGAGLKDSAYGPYFMRHVLQNTPRPWRHSSSAIPRSALPNCGAYSPNCSRTSRLSAC